MFTPVGSQIINFRVKPANLPVTVSERGLLESSENKDVFAEVEGGTTIIMILPEGKRVTKGELVCEARLVGAAGPAGQPGDHHQGGRGQLRERQADPPGRRDRRHRVHRGHLQAGPPDGPRRDRAGRVGEEPRRGPPRLVQADEGKGLRLGGAVHRRPGVVAAEDLRAGAGADQEGRAREIHQAQDDQGVAERGREGPLRRAGQAGDLGAGEVEAGQARAADLQVQAARAGRGAGRLRQRPEPLRRQLAAADRGGGGGPRAAEDLQPARHHPDAGQRQGPRVDGRPDHQGAARPHPRRRLRRPAADRHRRGHRPPARPVELLQPRTSRCTPPT